MVQADLQLQEWSQVIALHTPRYHVHLTPSLALNVQASVFEWSIGDLASTHEGTASAV